MEYVVLVRRLDSAAEIECQRRRLLQRLRATFSNLLRERLAGDELHHEVERDGRIVELLDVAREDVRNLHPRLRENFEVDDFLPHPPSGLLRSLPIECLQDAEHGW